MRTVALLGVLLAACGDNKPAADCDDGARNGNESDVDCGGACGAVCGLGASCDDNNDCLFGTCSSGTCTGPTDGATPTGPVVATIMPEGSTVAVVTNEHVPLTITFPAGAVRVPTEVTLTPRTPTIASWIDVTFEPSGLVFEEPITIEVALPTTAPAAQDAVLAFGSVADRHLLKTTLDGTTVRAASPTFGITTARCQRPKSWL